MRYDIKEFPFLIKPDKNNRDLLYKLEQLASKENRCKWACESCPFESVDSTGCLSFKEKTIVENNLDWPEMVDLYKKTFFKNDYIQEEMEL